jgi:hypothetical protein
MASMPHTMSNSVAVFATSGKLWFVAGGVGFIRLDRAKSISLAVA